MKVTRLEPQKRHTTRYNCFIDGEFFEGLDQNTVALFRLFVGKELSKEDCEEIRACEVTEKLHARMVRYLSRYRKTSADAKKYILGLGYSEKSAEEEIARLCSYKFLDDRQYALDFIAGHPSCGARLLRLKLQQKGIPRDIIDDTVGADDTEMLKALARKKWKTVKDKPNASEKLMRFCLSRGYSYEDVKEIAREIVEENHN